MPKKKDTLKLKHHHYSGIQKELETIYITSSGDKYIKENDAVCAESQIQQARESKQRRRNKIMGIMEVILDILKEENWGFYYKNEPMRSLITKEGGTLYEVNTVDLDEIERVLFNKLESINAKEESWKKHTVPHSQQEENLQNNN